MMNNNVIIRKYKYITWNGDTDPLDKRVSHLNPKWKKYWNEHGKPV